MEAQIFQISEGGLKPMTAEGKNDLPAGTILQLNGYSDPRYVISKNMGINPKYPGYGARYVSVNLENLSIEQHDAYSLKFLSEKKDDRIQIYITDETMRPELVEELYQRAEQKASENKAIQEKTAEKTRLTIESGKALIESKQPASAKAVIVACQEFDDCDMQTDYFNTKDGPLYILAWSKHTRDIFGEMRKAALNLEETKHLGPGCDIYQPLVVLLDDVTTNDGSGYWKGNRSPWHREMYDEARFFTFAEAEAHTKEKGEPEPISIDGTTVNFEWKIEKESIEHREKYSMGAGYYLKDSHRYSTGWKIEKHCLKHGMDSIYLAAGAGRYMVPEKAAPQVAVESVEGVTVTENEEKNGVEIRFPGKPEPSVISAIKSHGFRWHRREKFWYAKRTPERLEFSNSLV